MKNINEKCIDNQLFTWQIVETTNISVKTLARGDYGYYLHTQAGSIKQLPLEKLIDSLRDPKKSR